MQLSQAVTTTDRHFDGPTLIYSNIIIYYNILLFTENEMNAFHIAVICEIELVSIEKYFFFFYFPILTQLDLLDLTLI